MSFAKFLTTTAAAGLLATSTVAQEVGTQGSVDAGTNVDATTSAGTVGVGTDLTANADTNVDSTGTAGGGDTDATVTAQADVATDITEESDFHGNTVVLTDGTVVGTVDQVMLEAKNKQQIFVEIDDALETEAERFSVMMDADATSDGEISIAQTEAEFLANLEGQLDTQG
ncbi:PRC-barrel domain-containing protein [Thalassorhabdomicrobium marinisediminis]|uniref:PRC-barrel domain-containing protein n=1 Tax=Thalassorhabdomicrobium marinisediminis TaxID=2170577 RepID=UPI0024908E1C|nr:PRC-barrel domain-containing protein [Thalassorhabdomicrobium marinisediminis]